MDSGSQEESREETLARLATLLRLVPGAWVVVVAEGDLLVRGILNELGERLAPLKVNEISFIGNEPDPLLLAERFPAEIAEAAPVLAFRHLSVVTPRVFLNLDLKREALALLQHRLVFFVSESERLQMLAQAPNFYSRLRAFFRFAPLESSSDRERIALVPSPTASLLGSRLYRLRPSLGPISERDRESRIRGLHRRLAELRQSRPVDEQTFGYTLLDLADLEEPSAPKQAEEHYREAATHLGRAENLPARSDALISAGVTADKLGNPLSALDYFRQARELIPMLQSDRFEAELLLLEAEAQGQLGRVEDAEVRLRMALERFEELGDPIGTARSSTVLSQLQIIMGRNDEAKSSIVKALETYRRLRNQDGIAASYFQLGNVTREAGDLDQALEWYRRSHEILEKVGNKPGLASSYHQLGRIAQELGNYDQALDSYGKSLQISTELGDQHGVAISFYELGSISRERGEYVQALDWYTKAVELFEAFDDKIALALTYGQMSALLTAADELADAVVLNLRSLAIFAELKLPQTNRNLSLFNRQRSRLGETRFREILEEHLKPDLLQALLSALDKLAGTDLSSEGDDVTP